jgi:hypothetical protein
MSLTRKQAKKLYRREVYRNLHFKDETVYSVRKDGLVDGHALMVVMDGVTFAVGPKGNKRVRDEQRKNVHALVRGYIMNAIWYPEDKDDLPYLKENAEGLEGMEWGVPSSRNTNISDLDDPRAWTPMFEWKEVTYNPYKYKTFVTIKDEEPIYQARKVIIGPKVWAMVPTTKKSEEN